MNSAYTAPVRFAFLVLFTLVGCAGTVRSPAGDQARATLYGCHVEKASALDDRQSDAGTIGRQVHRACLVEARAALESSVSTWASPAYRDRYDAEFMRGAQDQATRVVLEGRR